MSRDVSGNLFRVDGGKFGLVWCAKGRFLDEATAGYAGKSVVMSLPRTRLRWR
jgi:hypothetical protein